MKNIKIKLLLVSALCFLLVACGEQSADSTSTPSTETTTVETTADVAPATEEGQLDLSGQTLTIVVGFNPGGGTDTSARLLNKYLSKHLPGQPNVIIQNMNGAAGIRALNYVYERARPDGLTMLYAPISLLVPLLGEPGIRYELDKYDVVGGLQAGPLVQFARHDVLDDGKIDSPAEIMDGKDLRLGGIRKSSSLDLMARLAMDTLQLEHKYITGYSSENTVRNAIQTSEINTFSSTFSGYRSAVDSTLVVPGVVAPLWQFPYRDADGNYPRTSFSPNIPTFMEVYEAIKGESPTGEHWNALKLALDLRSVADNMLLAPPNTDAAVLAALRESFAKSLQDPEMIAEVNTVLGYSFEVVPTDYIGRRFAEVSEADLSSVEFIKAYMAEVQ